MANRYRRNQPGTKAKDFCKWFDESFKEMEKSIGTSRAVQELIRVTIHRDPSNIEAILKMPEAIDKGIWICVHLRQFCMELNGLVVKLQSECKKGICTLMKTTTHSIYLCSAHENPKACPAIDYTLHTLDCTTSLLSRDKYFYSSVMMEKSTNSELRIACRRINVIFSHAFHHHREIFNEFETETHLCKRLRIFTKSFLEANLFTYMNIEFK